MSEGTRLNWNTLPSVIVQLKNITERGEDMVNANEISPVELTALEDAVQFLTYQLRTKTTQKAYHEEQNARIRRIKATLSAADLAKIDAEAKAKVNGGTTL